MTRTKYVTLISMPQAAIMDRKEDANKRIEKKHQKNHSLKRFFAGEKLNEQMNKKESHRKCCGLKVLKHIYYFWTNGNQF